MQRTGFAELPLHYGKAPQWLVKRMIKLAKGVISIILQEYGHDTFLSRISDPFWFQALGCVLGYDWHSSGVTTVVTGILKSAVNPVDHGIAICGGKGKASKHTPHEIFEVGESYGLSTRQIHYLQYASRMCAKVDNVAIQAGYPLYHHVFIITENGNWAVIQQGMSVQDRTARRYHWLSKNIENFLVEPHSAIVGDTRRDKVLDMTAVSSEGCRTTSVEIVKEKPGKIARMIRSVRRPHQRTLSEWLPKTTEPQKDYTSEFLSLPRNINWKAVRKAYEIQPRTYEDLLSISGIGPATVKGLALISELIYGEKPSWEDPIKYSFAYGGKDGVPFPVDRNAMDESIQILEDAIKNVKLGNREKLRSLRMLKRFTSFY